MGLEVIKRKNQIFNYELEPLEEIQNISNLIIPFSIIFRKNSDPDIYSCEESLPFRKRDPEFQEILCSEFLID